GQPFQQGREGRPGTQGAAPGQPFQQEREGRPGAPGGPAQGELRGNQGQRDQRNLREGRTAAPNVPGAAPNATGAAPGAQRNEGRGDMRGAQPGREQPGRDQRGLREGGPAAPSQTAPGEVRRGPQAGAPSPSTSGAAPSSREP